MVSNSVDSWMFHLFNKFDRIDSSCQIHTYYIGLHTWVQLPFLENEKKKKKKKKHSPLNSSIVLNHGKLFLDLCNKQVGNKCVSKFLHRIRMIRERVIGGSTLSLGWSLDHPSLKKKVIIYNIKSFMISYS